MIQIQNAYTKYDELNIKSHKVYILSAIKCGKVWSILTYYWENSRLKKEFDGSERICKWARFVWKGTFSYISFEPVSIQETWVF